MIKLFQLLSKNVVEKDSEREELLVSNKIILSDLENEVDNKLQQTQYKTAKKIFKRFVKNPKLVDVGIQIDLDEMMANLAEVI